MSFSFSVGISSCDLSRNGATPEISASAPEISAFNPGV